MNEIENQIRIELRKALSLDAEALMKFLIKCEATVELRIGTFTTGEILFVEFDSPNFHFIMEV